MSNSLSFKHEKKKAKKFKTQKRSENQFLGMTQKKGETSLKSRIKKRKKKKEEKTKIERQSFRGLTGTPHRNVHKQRIIFFSAQFFFVCALKSFLVFSLTRFFPFFSGYSFAKFYICKNLAQRLFLSLRLLKKHQNIE